MASDSDSTASEGASWSGFWKYTSPTTMEIQKINSEVQVIVATRGFLKDPNRSPI